jgi:hypothetical protein
MLILLLAAFVPVQTATASTQYPPGAFVLSLSATVVGPGDPATITASACISGSSVEISIEGTNTRATGACGADFITPVSNAALVGGLSVTLSAPDTAGTYTVRGAEVSTGRAATAVLSVIDSLSGNPDGGTPAGGTTPSSSGGGDSNPLPVTGSQAWRLGLAAAVVIGLGTSLALVSRRRRLSSAH